MFKKIDPTELESMNAFRAVGKEWFLITAEVQIAELSRLWCPLMHLLQETQ